MTKAEIENKKWVNDHIAPLGAKARAKALKGWQQVYDETYAAEPIEHKKQNAARRAANIRLREFVGKLMINRA